MSDLDFTIEFSSFNEGLSPLAHLDTRTFVGNKGQASEMKADVISNPGFLTQSPGLEDLTNGNQDGVVDQLIRFILDKPTDVNTTYAIGTTKLFRLSATEVDSGERLSSVSPSISPSVSPSTSPSVSLSPSVSSSISPSISPSLSPSASPSVSISPSISPSVSPSVSLSPSVSPSTSPSVSLSPSASPSTSPSASVSPSPPPSWPQTITDMTEGESVIRLKTNLYGFFNKTSGGDIFKMPLSTETIDATWGSDTDKALEKAPHPVAVKEDIMVFGNGRYVGVYVEGSAALDVQKLDFGEGSEVVDIVFNANLWHIAVNYGEGKKAQIYQYDGAALSNTLDDEAGVGDQQIGFLYVLNGIIYIFYKDTTSDGFNVGWLAGRQIKPLRYFTGTLPTHRQKALYKNAILFTSSASIFSMGASVEQLPLQISKLADGGYATLGGLASPFGTPMIASTNGGSKHRLAKFSGYSVDSLWKSVLVDITKGRMIGKVHTIIVNTKALVGDAQCDITLEGNQGAKTMKNALEVKTEDKTMHVFKTIMMGQIEDVRLIADYSNGDTTNACPIRKIKLLGNFVER